MHLTQNNGMQFKTTQKYDFFFTYKIYKDQFDKHWVGEDVGKL